MRVDRISCSRARQACEGTGRKRLNSLARALAGLAATVVAGAAAPGVRALDLGGEDSRHMETLAYREMLKTYDNSKRYGAERMVDRSRQEWSPDGIPIGNYVVFPDLASRLVFDDNVLATASGAIADLRHELSASAGFQSHLPRHVLDFAVGGRLVSYLTHDELDHADGFAALNAGLHFDHAHTLSMSVLSALDHEDPLQAPLSANAVGFVPVWHNKVAVGLKRDAGRLYGSVGFAAQSWDYQDVKATDGTTIDQDTRDVAIYAGSVRMGYRFSPGYEVQGKIRVLRQDTWASGEPSRDAWGYEAIAGLAAEVNPLLRWRLMGGYALRDYDRPELATTTTSLLEAEVQWLPTQVMTVSLRARRALNDGIASDGSADQIDTIVTGQVDYELWRNLIFTLQGEYRDSEFTQESRRDQLYGGRIALEYMPTKNWVFSLGYEHLQRQSNKDENDLVRNRVWGGARLRF